MADEQPTPHEGDEDKPRSPLPPLSAPFRALVLHGPWVLILSGVGMLLFGFFAHRPDGVLIAALGFGTGMVSVGVLAPRIAGETSLSPTGITIPMGGISPDLISIARNTAEKMAAELPGEQEAKERRVNEVVGEVLTDFAGRGRFSRSATRGRTSDTDLEGRVQLVCTECGRWTEYEQLPQSDSLAWICRKGHRPTVRKAVYPKS